MLTFRVTTLRWDETNIIYCGFGSGGIQTSARTSYGLTQRIELVENNYLKLFGILWLQCISFSSIHVIVLLFQEKSKATYFVVVLHYLRCVVIAVRGTETAEDLITDGLGRACSLTPEDLDGLAKLVSISLLCL